MSSYEQYIGVEVAYQSKTKPGSILKNLVRAYAMGYSLEYVATLQGIASKVHDVVLTPFDPYPDKTGLFNGDKVGGKSWGYLLPQGATAAEWAYHPSSGLTGRTNTGIEFVEGGDITTPIADLDIDLQRYVDNSKETAVYRDDVQVASGAEAEALINERTHLYGFYWPSRLSYLPMIEIYYLDDQRIYPYRDRQAWETVDVQVQGKTARHRKAVEPIIDLLTVEDEGSCVPIKTVRELGKPIIGAVGTNAAYDGPGAQHFTKAIDSDLRGKQGGESVLIDRSLRFPEEIIHPDYPFVEDVPDDE